MKINFYPTVIMCLYSCLCIAQVSPPAGWSDFRMGLVNDGNATYNTRMKKAMDEGVKLDYRYVYINNGPDSATNSLSWLFNEKDQWYKVNYAKDCATKVKAGLKPAFVIYMLQEDGGTSVFQSNVNDVNFMRKFFATVSALAKKVNGYNACIVVEPDTWGYLLQSNVNPTTATANVNNLGPDFSFLSAFPNTVSGLCQAIIHTFRTYAPDANVGILMSHWAVWAAQSDGITEPRASDGMVWWSAADINFSAQKNADFFNKLFQGATDKGDFLGVEKNGYSAGVWATRTALGKSQRYYWGDNENKNWINWSAKLSTLTNLPLLGWQISIGHIGLPNVSTMISNSAFEDTFFEYFFNHTQDYISAGFIAMLVGKGQADDTDYTNLSVEPTKGDRGWFFEQLKTFDSGRPYFINTSITNSNSSTNYKISSSGNSLFISFESAHNKTISLYTVEGKLLFTMQGNDSFIEIPLNSISSEILLLKVNENVNKIAVVY